MVSGYFRRALAAVAVTIGVAGCWEWPNFGDAMDAPPDKVPFYRSRVYRYEDSLGYGDRYASQAQHASAFISYGDAQIAILEALRYCELSGKKDTARLRRRLPLVEAKKAEARARATPEELKRIEEAEAYDARRIERIDEVVKDAIKSEKVKRKRR